MRPKWTRAEIDALDKLYQARERWAAISEKVSVIHGNVRTPSACRKKAQACGMTQPERYRTANQITSYDADICDMMMMDYGLPRMARELESQYGRHFSTGFIWLRAQRGGATYRAWRDRHLDRRSRAAKAGWDKRRRKAA